MDSEYFSLLQKRYIPDFSIKRFDLFPPASLLLPWISVSKGWLIYDIENWLLQPSSSSHSIFSITILERIVEFIKLFYMRNNDSYNIDDNGDEYDDLFIIPAFNSSNNGEVVGKFTIILWFIPDKNQYSTPASTDSFRQWLTA